MKNLVICIQDFDSANEGKLLYLQAGGNWIYTDNIYSAWITTQSHADDHIKHVNTVNPNPGVLGLQTWISRGGKRTKALITWAQLHTTQAKEIEIKTI